MHGAHPGHEWQGPCPTMCPKDGRGEEHMMDLPPWLPCVSGLRRVGQKWGPRYCGSSLKAAAGGVQLLGCSCLDSASCGQMSDRH